MRLIRISSSIIITLSLLVLTGCTLGNHSNSGVSMSTGTPSSISPKQIDSISKPTCISSSGFNYTMVDKNGQMIAWGDDCDTAGSWARETETFYKFLSADNIVSVSRDRWSLLFVDDNDLLWGVGWSPWGMYQQELEQEYTPVEIMADIKMASIGYRCYLALDNEGNVWIWGTGAYGQVGTEPEALDGNNPLFEPIKVMTSVSYAITSGGASYAIKEDGSLWGWGGIGIADENGLSHRITPEFIMDDVVHVAGGTQAFAIKRTARFGHGEKLRSIWRRTAENFLISVWRVP